MVTYVDESPSLMSSYVSRNPSWKGSVDLSNKYEDFENAALSELAVFDHFTDSDIFPIIDSHSDRSSWNSKDGAYPYPLHVSNHNILDDGETSYEFVGKKFRDNSSTYDEKYFPPIKGALNAGLVNMQETPVVTELINNSQIFYQKKSPIDHEKYGHEIHLECDHNSDDMGLSTPGTSSTTSAYLAVYTKETMFTPRRPLLAAPVLQSPRVQLLRYS